MTISEQLFESKAENYLKYESFRRIPFGATIAKDSFAVDQSGAFMSGPLFIVEKLPVGFNSVSGDWRYTLIQPHGSVSVRTNGDHADKVAFYVSCHLAAGKKPPVLRTERVLAVEYKLLAGLCFAVFLF